MGNEHLPAPFIDVDKFYADARIFTSGCIELPMDNPSNNPDRTFQTRHLKGQAYLHPGFIGRFRLDEHASTADVCGVVDHKSLEALVGYSEGGIESFVFPSVVRRLVILSGCRLLDKGAAAGTGNFGQTSCNSPPACSSVSSVISMPVLPCGSRPAAWTSARWRDGYCPSGDRRPIAGRTKPQGLVCDKPHAAAGGIDDSDGRLDSLRGQIIRCQNCEVQGFAAGDLRRLPSFAECFHKAYHTSVQ